MTASQTAKALGCKSLSQVSQLTGVSLQTLGNWHKDKPELFKVVCIGTVAQHLISHRDMAINSQGAHQ